MSMYIGEGLSGEGNEIAHIDLLIGDKDGPVGNAFANALATQSSGHNNLLAVLTPNLAVKPATVMITKVTIKGMKQAVQMFGPAQAAVAKAVADSVGNGVIPKGKAEDLVIVCGVFIHPAANDDKKIYKYNYDATMLAIANAMAGKPTVDEMLAGSRDHQILSYLIHGHFSRAATAWPAINSQFANNILVCSNLLECQLGSLRYFQFVSRGGPCNASSWLLSFLRRSSPFQCTVRQAPP